MPKGSVKRKVYRAESLIHRLPYRSEAYGYLRNVEGSDSFSSSIGSSPQSHEISTTNSYLVYDSVNPFQEAELHADSNGYSSSSQAPILPLPTIRPRRLHSLGTPHSGRCDLQV